MKTRLSRLKKNQMNITINPKYEYLSPFIQSLPTVFETTGTMLHDKRNVVKQFDIEGRAIVVKRYKVPLFFQRIDYTFCRPSKAKRAYLFALRLIELGIQTPDPATCTKERRRTDLCRHRACSCGRGIYGWHARTD